MNQNDATNIPRRNRWLSPNTDIPGVQPLAHTIADASASGVLFFLAVELELLLERHFTHNRLPPTAIDLEIMLAEAAKALLGE